MARWLDPLQGARQQVRGETEEEDTLWIVVTSPGHHDVEVVTQRVRVNITLLRVAVVDKRVNITLAQLTHEVVKIRSQDFAVCIGECQAEIFREMPLHGVFQQHPAGITAGIGGDILEQVVMFTGKQPHGAL